MFSRDRMRKSFRVELPKLMTCYEAPKVMRPEQDSFRLGSTSMSYSDYWGFLSNDIIFISTDCLVSQHPAPRFQT